MANIIYDARKIKLMEALTELCDAVGYSAEWFNEFWDEIMNNENLFNEVLYYIDHNDLLGSYSIDGYTVLDLFIWQMQNYNLRHDTGKNDAGCCKEAMILNAFDTMAKMSKNINYYKDLIQSDMRLDK